MVKRRAALLCVLSLTGLAGAAMLIAQPAPEPAPDRSVEVNGWRVEDIAQPSEDDPLRRIIRMTRTNGSEELSFDVDISGQAPEGWGNNSFAASGSNGDRFCNASGPVMAETGPPEERAQRVRTVLARELGELERQCRSAAGTMAHYLDGFEGGFALLSAWHNERQAEVTAILEASYGDNAAVPYDYYDDMDVNMGEGDMMEMSNDAVDDFDAANGAMEAAYNAIGAEPQ